MATFRDIKSKFKALPEEEQEKFLKDIYDFSKNMKLFMEGWLIGTDGKEFIKQMEKETVGKIYRKGMPGMINGRTVNSIINKAKKSRVNIWSLLELEKLAYQGFIDFLNEFGGGPESYEDLAAKHLEEYLTLVKNQIRDKAEQEELIEETRKYLLEQDNMLTDYTDDVFESVTGMEVGRSYRY